MKRFSIDIAAGRIISVTPAGRSRLVVDGIAIPLPDGAVISPGFVDTHCHLIGLGEMASRVQLRGAGSAAECAARVAERASTGPRDTWIIGFGWNQEEWEQRELPDRHLLDAVAPDVPVVLYRIDTHAAWVNSAALAAAGIAPDERVIEGGRIERGGVLIDTAVDLVRRVIPAPGLDARRRWIEEGVEICLGLGLTEIHDMNVEPDRLEPMTLAAERGGMRLRCRVFLQAQHDEWRAVPHPSPLGANLDVVGVKYFADGALGSYGALLLEPYADRPASMGLQLMGSRELIERAEEPARRGFAVATHAIGDGANRLVLDAYQALRDRVPEALLRIEHAQIVHPDDVPRFSRHGVIAAMQAIHCTSDAAMAETRLGPERCAYAYGWRDLLDAGASVLGGSDFPIESPDPLLGIRAFHFREPIPGAGAWQPRQRTTREEALAAYTSNAPLGVPGHARRGALHPGADADLAVLSGDPFDADTQVLMTLVGGRIVFERA